MMESSYFQVFNKKNMLQRKMVLQFEYGNVFAKMNNSAFYCRR